MRPTQSLRLTLRLALRLALCAGLWLASWPGVTRAETAPTPLPAESAPVTPAIVAGEETGPIGPVLLVNGAAISGYELAQREAFFRALNQPGDLPSLARKALITDRLQAQAAKAMAVSVSPEELRAAMEEFAGRAKLPLPEFQAALAEKGVAPETLRDFVQAGLAWRAAARAKFAGKLELTEAEIDRAIGQGAVSATGRRLLLSELLIPADATRDIGALVGRVRAAIKDEADFARMARQFSKAATAARGGELGWIDEDKLPPEVVGALAGLHMGEMTQAVTNDQGVALYFLRDETAKVAEGTGAQAMDYALVPGGADGAMAASLMGCDALYGVARARGLGLTRQTEALGAVKGGLGPVLAAMDPGEARALPDGRLVMLCARLPVSTLPLSRAALREDLTARKLDLLAQAWAEELRFDAFIETP